MPATIHDHFINKSLLASLDAQAESDPDNRDSYPDDAYPPPDHQIPVYASQDYPTDLHFRQSKMTAAYSASYSASFTSYPNTTRSRHQASQSNNSYRDFYPSQDLYPSQITSPVASHVQPYDRNSYDYPSQQQQSAHKSPFILDPYAVPKSASQQQQQQATAQQQPYPFANGVVQLASQTPYGPHIPTSANSTAPGLTSSVSLAMANGAGPTTTTANGEEISTIFVVGFPEDMQEREFQNMFTFSPGFEAATLKIPNKEYTAYNGLIGGPSSLSSNGPQQPQRNYSASNDPYNLVTVNQGGVLVDGGRDGGMASWPAPPPSNPNDDLAAHYANAGMGGPSATNSSSILPPRKQIIGFAKFRSRDEALVARDVLQGRRVDIEKGAVLKAEMAKKNLHTKRGVGPVPGVGSAIGPVGTVLGVVPPGGVLGAPTGLQSQGQDASIHPLSSSSHFVDTFGMLTNGDSGVGSVRLPGTIGQRNSLKVGGTVLSGENEVFMRGARVRAEEDDRERERELLLLRERERGMSVSGSMGLDGTGLSAKEKEREREARLMRLRANNAIAFDAFHGVPAAPTSVGAGVNGVNGTTAGGSGSSAISRQNSSATSISSGSITGSGLWSSPTTIGTDAQSLDSVLEKQDSRDHDEVAEDIARYCQETAEAEDEAVEDRHRAAYHAEDAEADRQDQPEQQREDHQEELAQHEIDAHAPQRQGTDPTHAHATEAAADGRLSDEVHSQQEQHGHEHDEIVAPWDRISNANNSSGLGAGSRNGSVNGVSPAVSYAAVARPSATTGSERSTSPVGFLEAQQQQPAYMNQYQHLQYHHDVQAQRLAQQQQQTLWPSQPQQQQGWPTQQQQLQHKFHQQLQQQQYQQQQQQWNAQNQQPQHQYRSPQSESSETSAIGSASGGVEGSGPGPIGYVGARPTSGSTAARAGLGLGVDTNVASGLSNLVTPPTTSSIGPASAPSANGIERLDDLTHPKPASSSAVADDAVNGVGESVHGGSSPLPPPPPSSGSMSSITSASTGAGSAASGGSAGGSGGNTSPQLPSPASGSTTSGTSMRGTVDQNPPINTLYVGNLPTSPPPMGYPNDYLEETLRETFSSRPGFRKLCFRHKANGPMCFVEFEDVQYATRALTEMSGNTLRGTVKNGIRLSYSKNPLGVRTPTSAGGSGSSGGPTPLQQQQLMQTLSNHHLYQHQQHGSGGSGMGQGSVSQQQDSFQSRLADDFGGHPHHRLPPNILRRESTLSPTASSPPGYGASNGVNGSNGVGSFFSSPPPRFYTTSPGTNIAFGPSISSGSSSGQSTTQLTGASSAFVPRSTAAINAAAAGNTNGTGMGGMFGNGVGSYGSISQAAFAPFGVPFDNSPFASISSQHQQQQQHSFLPQHSIPDGQHQHHHHQQPEE